MASAVDICNLALSHIGNEATVASITPPESTVEAEKCAAFYPIARDQCLEAHAWSFNTRRVALAEVENYLDSWGYAYALPNGSIKELAVLYPEATDDDDTQAFLVESKENGSRVLYTNVEDATLRYQVRIVDTTKFSAQFVSALSWLLASYLAGPIIRGRAGSSVAKDCHDRFLKELGKATENNANSNQKDTYRNYRPKWIRDR